MKRYPTKYDGKWVGIGAVHPQIDTGFGFTVDEELVPFVAALRDKGFITTGGWCQNTSEVDGYPQWAVPRRRIGYTHSDPQALFRFCLHLKKLLPGSGWNQEITVDNYFVPNDPFATSTFTQKLDEAVLSAINSFSLDAA